MSRKSSSTRRRSSRAAARAGLGGRAVLRRMRRRRCRISRGRRPRGRPARPERDPTVRVPPMRGAPAERCLHAPSRQTSRSTDGAAPSWAEWAPSSEPSSSTLDGAPTHSKNSATRPSSWYRRWPPYRRPSTTNWLCQGPSAANARSIVGRVDGQPPRRSVRARATANRIGAVARQLNEPMTPPRSTWSCTHSARHTASWRCTVASSAATRSPSATRTRSSAISLSARASASARRRRCSSVGVVIGDRDRIATAPRRSARARRRRVRQRVAREQRPQLAQAGAPAHLAACAAARAGASRA